MFRHGDRSPIGTFPTDQYKESDWPQGYGQLSIVRVLGHRPPVYSLIHCIMQLGMQQEEMLGSLLRKRYVTDTNFLNSSYRRVEVS